MSSMRQSVDPDRILDLSEELRRYRDRNMDALTQRLKELTLLVNETQYSYSEYYVRNAASEVQQLMGEIRSLMQSCR